VRVDEAREQRAPDEVDHPGRAIRPGLELRATPDGGDPVTLDAERLDDPVLLVHREDGPADVEGAALRAEEAPPEHGCGNDAEEAHRLHIGIVARIRLRSHGRTGRLSSLPAPVAEAYGRRASARDDDGRREARAGRSRRAGRGTRDLLAAA
jgi:hypothetical protein